ncbi:MAG: RiPP maturation radical SAM protein 1 [bacterium]|nr:RiPP maturation radical SAM protein 1 [bacterium]
MEPKLLIETSRGCWWGAKHHCTFCGLNRDEMTFREKSPGRVLAEIRHLVGNYGNHFISATDNIMSMSVFRTLLPELKRLQLDVELFYETKANLREDQIQLLADAGVVRIQPGIESFSRSVLKRIRKGVTPLQNVQLLRWCQIHGVDPHWNLLYGFPGEKKSDYDRNLRFVRALGHLPPPEGYGSLRLDRFSPYFDDPQEFGIRGLQAFRSYEYIYPFSGDVLDRLAYFFEFDFDGRDQHDSWIEPVLDAVDRWIDQYSTSKLEIVGRTSGSMVVRDTRANRVADRFMFEGVEAEIMDLCSEPATVDSLLADATGDVSAEWLVGFLGSQEQRRLLLSDAGRYLSVVLPENG